MIKILIFSLFFSISAFSQQTEIKIMNLSCEFKENPLGIETNNPRLSWLLISKNRNQVQSAYRIIVSDNPDGFEKHENKAFNDRFFDKAKMTYDKGSQTANAMAIYFELVKPEFREAVLKSLILDIKNRNYALTSGDIGWRYVVNVLHNEGLSEILFKMNNRTDVPGYGYKLSKDATTLIESWYREDVSNNHLMLGHIREWFYGGLAGITQTSESIAYKEIIIRPELAEDLTEVNGNFLFPYGLIQSHWKLKRNTFAIDITIPPNSNALVFLPASKQSPILEGNRNINKIKSIHFLKWENDSAIYKIGSGTYHFTSKIAVNKKYPQIKLLC